jgi:HAD superfamily hydrolase (TIGR01509 family)
VDDRQMIIIRLYVSLVMVVSSVAVVKSLAPPKSLQGVLFDIDGTLVNSDPIHFAVFQELLLKEEHINNKQQIDEAFFRKWISGRANALITADLFPDWSVAARQEWSIRKEERFRQVAQATMADSKMDGLDKFRDWIDEERGLQKAAVTNAPRLNAEAILKGIQYDHWFDCVIIGDECERPKPDPCPYLTACKVLGINAENCIVVEDSPSGARAGVAAGAFVIGILSGQDQETLESAGCHMIIDDFNDPKLWTLLKKLAVGSVVSSTQ